MPFNVEVVFSSCSVFCHMPISVSRNPKFHKKMACACTTYCFDLRNESNGVFVLGLVFF